MTQDRYVELFGQTKLAAEQGDKKAQSLLGAIYCEGSGVAKNYVEAVGWWKLAAAQGDASAQNY
jgi:TPR repeat protein